jgi:hypothetical protein
MTSRFSKAVKILKWVGFLLTLITVSGILAYLYWQRQQRQQQTAPLFDSSTTAPNYNLCVRQALLKVNPGLEREATLSTYERIQNTCRLQHPASAE